MKLQSNMAGQLSDHNLFCSAFFRLSPDIKLKSSDLALSKMLVVHAEYAPLSIYHYHSSFLRSCCEL